jgi:hypothetical protein
MIQRQAGNGMSDRLHTGLGTKANGHPKGVAILRFLALGQGWECVFIPALWLFFGPGSDGIRGTPPHDLPVGQAGQSPRVNYDLCSQPAK